MATHLTWVKESRATVVLHPGGNAQALLTWRANTATGPAPFNPNIVHVTPPDEHAYLLAVWPGGPVRGGDIAAWPLRAAPAGPFPAGTGTVSGRFNGMYMTLAADGTTVGWRGNAAPAPAPSSGSATATARSAGWLAAVRLRPPPHPNPRLCPLPR